MDMRELLAKKMKASNASETKSLGYFKPNKQVSFYEPIEGKNVIDIIPFVQANGEPTYVQEVYVHKGIGVDKKTVLCNHKMFKKPCPICEEVARLGEDYKKNEDLYKALKAKHRVIYNIRDAAAPEKGIQIFEVSWFLFEKGLLKESLDPMDTSKEIIIFSDLESGYSVQFRATEETYGQAKYFKYSSFSFRERNPIPETIINETVQLDSCLIIPTYKEVQEIFLGISSDDYEDEKKVIDEPFPDNIAERPTERKAKYDSVEQVPTKCPAGHTYGIDVDKFPECASCEKWTDCTDNN